MGIYLHLMSGLLAGLLAVAVQAYGQEADVRASTLIGSQVSGANGGRIGEIVGLLIDVRERGVHYALLAVERAGGAEERFAYPLNAFHRSGDRRLALNVPRERLRELPGFDGRDWPDPRFRSGTRYVAAARLFARDVEDRIGNRVGRIEDAMLSLDTGTTEALLVAFDGQATPLRLPTHLIRLQVEGSAVLQADRARRLGLGAHSPIPLKRAAWTVVLTACHLRSSVA